MNIIWTKEDFARELGKEKKIIKAIKCEKCDSRGHIADINKPLEWHASLCTCAYAQALQENLGLVNVEVIEDRTKDEVELDLQELKEKQNV